MASLHAQEEGPRSPAPTAKIAAAPEEPLPPGATLRLGTTRLRTTANQIVFAPDGKTFLTTTGARALNRWDAATGRLLKESDLPGPMYANSRFSPDGKLLAVQEEKGIGIWDVETKKQIIFLVLLGLTRPEHIAFAPDAPLLATAEYTKDKGILRLWDLTTGKGRVLAELPSYANSLAFGPNGQRLFAAVDNHSLRCWDTVNGNQLWKNDQWARHIALAPGGLVLASDSYREGPLRLWNADTGKEIGTLGKAHREAASLAFSPDGATLAHGTWHQGVFLHDVRTRKLRHHLASAGPFLAFAPDSGSLLTLGKVLGRWDLQSGKPIYEDTRGGGHVDRVIAVAYSPDGKTLASYGLDDTLRTWDLATGKFNILRTDAPGRRFSGMVYDGRLMIGSSLPLFFTPDARALLIEVEGGVLALADAHNGKELRRFRLPPVDRGSYGVAATRLTANGKRLLALGQFHQEAISSYIAIGNREEPVQTWDLTTGRELSGGFVLGTWVQGSAFSPHGRLLVTPTQVIDLQTRAAWRLGEEKDLFGTPFFFSPDGQLIAAIEANGENAIVHAFGISTPSALRIYEAQSGRLLSRMEVNLGFNRAFAFSPDGRVLVAAGTDGLFGWECTTGRRVLHLPARDRLTHWRAEGFAQCLAFSPDGQSLATGHALGVIHLWDLSPITKSLKVLNKKADVAACWDDLLAEDPKRAYAAIDTLAADPEAAVSFLGKKLAPEKVDPLWVAVRLKKLRDPNFKVREEASQELETMVELIETDLRKELAGETPLEVTRRLEQILKKLPARRVSAAMLRDLRATVVLERIGSAQAQAVLRNLAEGSPDSWLTQAAQGALGRLEGKRF